MRFYEKANRWLQAEHMEDQFDTPLPYLLAKFAEIIAIEIEDKQKIPGKHEDICQCHKEK